MSWLVRLRFRRILFLSGLIAGAILNYIANPTEEDRKPIIQPVSLERFVIAGAFRGACTQNLAKRQFSSGAWYPVWALRRPPRRRRYKAWERMHPQDHPDVIPYRNRSMGATFDGRVATIANDNLQQGWPMSRHRTLTADKGRVRELNFS